MILLNYFRREQIAKNEESGVETPWTTSLCLTIPQAEKFVKIISPFVQLWSEEIWHETVVYKEPTAF